MTKTYYIDHPTKDDYEIEIPNTIRDQIIKDFFQRTYYWSVGILCTMVGFLLGVLVK